MRRQYIYVVAVLETVISVVFVVRAVRLFQHPFPVGMMSTQWYEELLAAFCSGALAIACVAYDIRINRTKQSEIARTNRWRDKIELRALLYFWAIVGILGIPVAAYKAVQATHDPIFQNTFWSAYSGESFVWAGLGIAVIVYDRHRIRREARDDHNLCSVCGYDLRAATDRCPECGTKIAVKNLDSSN
jgi:hypothetical protein